MITATKIRKSGNSLAIIIPAPMARHAGLEFGHEVEMTLQGSGEIMVRALSHALPDMTADINSLGYKELSEEVLALGAFISNASEQQVEDADKARSRLIKLAGRLSALSSIANAQAAPVVESEPVEVPPASEPVIEANPAPVEAEAAKPEPAELVVVSETVVTGAVSSSVVRVSGVTYEWVVEYVDKAGVARADAVGDSLSEVWDEAVNGAYTDKDYGYLQPVLSLQRAGAGLTEGRHAFVVGGRLMANFGDTPTSGLTNDAVPFEFHQELEQLANDTGRVPTYFDGKSLNQMSL